MFILFKISPGRCSSPKARYIAYTPLLAVITVVIDCPQVTATVVDCPQVGVTFFPVTALYELIY
jgi:hypothetical protein